MRAASMNRMLGSGGGGAGGASGRAKDGFEPGGQAARGSSTAQGVGPLPLGHGEGSGGVAVDDERRLHGAYIALNSSDVDAQGRPRAAAPGLTLR